MCNLTEDLILTLLFRSYTGDKEAYGELLSWLQGHCMAQLKIGLRSYRNFPTELYSDIVQDILIAFHQTHQTFDTSRPFFPWINSLIRYKTIDFLRKKDFRVLMSGTDIEILKYSWVVEDEKNSGVSEDLVTLLDLLPKNQADAIRLSKIKGLTNKEVATELNISESNAKVTVFRGLNFLKKLISEKRK